MNEKSIQQIGRKKSTRIRFSRLISVHILEGFQWGLKTNEIQIR